MRFALPHKLQIFMQQQMHKRLCHRFKQARCIHVVPVPDDLKFIAACIPGQFLRWAPRLQYMIDDDRVSRACCFGGKNQCSGIVPECAGQLGQPRWCPPTIIGQYPGESEPLQHTAVVIEAFAMPKAHAICGVDKVQRKIISDE